MSLDQEGFRWRNDDGDEAAATWKAAQDTSISLPIDQNMRLRVLVNDASPAPAASAYRLEFATHGGSDWKPVAPSTGYKVELKASSNIASGGEATTAQLIPPAGKTTADFVTGRMWDDESGLDDITIGADKYTELEFCLQAVSANGAVPTDHFDFRVTIGAFDVAPAGDITHIAADWDAVDVESDTHVYNSGLTVAAGDTIVIAVWNYQAGSSSDNSTAEVTDNHGNTYDFVEQVDGPAGIARGATYVVKSAIGGTNYTPTVVWSASAAKKILAFHIVHNAHPTSTVVGNKSNAQSATGTGTDAITSTAVVPSADKAYIFGFTAATAFNGTILQGTGFTFDNSGGFGAGTHGAFTEHLIQSTAESVEATFSPDTSSDNVITMLVALQPAPA
jgi:hypothetical protein